MDTKNPFIKFYAEHENNRLRELCSQMRTSMRRASVSLDEDEKEALRQRIKELDKQLESEG